MSDLIITNESIDFWVWINPEHLLTKLNVENTGRIFSGGLVAKGKSNLMFIPNPEFGGDISLFNMGINNNYNVEYILETFRLRSCPDHPSRLMALFLFFSKEEAEIYQQTHEDHVKNRNLKKCHSCGKVTYSIHDSAWIDFMRGWGMKDDFTINNCCNSYWRGINVKDCKLSQFGEPWSQEPAREVLLLGQVEFYNRNLDSSDS